jgi:nucleolar MIF4G domain-containing protein 1
LNFGYLQPKTTTFLEVLLTSTILQTQKKSGEAHDEGSLLQVFSKVADAPQMARGLQYFLKKVVSKADIAGSKSEKRIVRWGCGVLDGLLSSIEPPVVAAN